MECENGQPLWISTLTRHSSYVSSIAFSPDSRTLASGSYDETVRLWDVKTGRHLQTLAGALLCSFHSIAFSPDGQTLASAADNTICLWGMKTVLAGHTD